MLGQVAHGEDPAEKRKAQKSLVTIKDLTQDYIERHGARKRPRSLKEDQELLNKIIFENLGSLRPTVLQALLENCSSVKAKRVAWFLAHRNHHPWVQDLDLSRIDLGKGPREVVKKGTYDPQFKITYPKGLFEDDRLEV